MLNTHTAYSLHQMNYPQPTSLFELIHLARNEKVNNQDDSYANCLIRVLKKYHMWPLLQVKKFKNDDFLVLLHNSYQITEVEDSFKELYSQCRSIVLDFTDAVDETVVVSYANNIPVRISAENYSHIMTATDWYQEAYDGTSVTVYNYKDTWHFGTSTCTDINFSKFSNPNKSHGEMLNEVLMHNFRSYFTDEELVFGDINAIETKLRGIFTSHLDKNCAYEFVLIHHENTHIVDYSDVYGTGYKLLFHINTKHRGTCAEVDISNSPYSSIGIAYPVIFPTYGDAINHILTTKSYGFIAKQASVNGAKLYKISPDRIDFIENTNPCNPNVWQNMLAVYMKNNKQFKIVDYLNIYNPVLELPKDNKGRDIDPTYLIHTMISTIRDVLYNLYIATTTYNAKTNHFKMNKELDKQFPPIIRFHLAQLRHRQQHNHKNAIIGPKEVYYYLCQCNTIKNIKLLVSFFSGNTGCGYNISERSAVCIAVLNELL